MAHMICASRDGTLFYTSLSTPNKYLEMNLLLQETGIDWSTDSLDKGDHLNLSGACKVTEYLGDYLRNHYKLPDHRGESGYEAWEVSGKEYQKKVRKKLQRMR